MKDIKRFPFQLFFIYVTFYSAQSILNSYFNLYLDSIGITKTAIGILGAFTTAIPLLANPFWGIRSDRSKNKTRILQVLMIVSTFIPLTYYFSKNYIYIIIIGTIFAVFYNAVMSLQDNLSLEYLEGSKWDFGKIRMGGTIGYAVTVGAIGFILHNQYSNIFWMFAVIMAISSLLYFKIPPVAGRSKDKEKLSVKLLLTNKPLICLIGFGVLYSMGMSIYYSYYPIYFTSIGGDSSLIGTMLFTCAIAEVPFLLISKKMINKFGIENIMVAAAIVTSLRWFCLSFLTNPIAIILINMLHGFGFVGFNFSMVVYINTRLPKGLRATGQVINGMVNLFFNKIVFGAVGGWASDLFGVNNMMKFAGILTLAAGIVFFFLYRLIMKSENQKQLQA